MTLEVACEVVWDFKRRPCEAWGAPSSHGCKHKPGHEGKHACPCGSTLPLENVRRIAEESSDG